MELNNTNRLVDGILQGDRVALGRAITLAESTKTAHRAIANEVIRQVIPHTGNSRRIGITGIPGAGKSTFIEAYGYRLAEKGNKVAVLAVDPSGQMSKGSILGDKTRMEKLASHENAFIRPTPSGNMLGGVAAGTADAILLCEAAGYTHIMVETVGVGQSETTVKDLTDIFLLLSISGAGDELQGIKRGIMEMADIVAVNKADSGNENQAKQTAHRLKSALHFFPNGNRLWEVPVLSISSTQEGGTDELAQKIEDCFTILKNENQLVTIRKAQDKKRFFEMVQHIGMKFIMQNPQTIQFIQEAEKEIESGKKTGFTAALEFEKLIQL